MEHNYLKGNIAFISGAYRNLGKIIAFELADRGADIVVNDLQDTLTLSEKNEFLSQLSNKGVRAIALDGDISSLEEVEVIRQKILESLGKVSIVVNCAGPFDLTPFLELEERKWDIVMDVNLKAIFLTAKCFAHDMKDRGWGRIINLSAGSAFVRNHGVYGLAKAGVRFITEELALELGPEITVNAVSPGQIEESLPIIHEIDPGFGERYKERSPLKKLVKRENIAALISSLCSPVADLITGETIRIDAGAELPRF
jgi:NAD(P)-dependent dehydrogenase (short-subunit alcohol dehydrogenase family)